MNKKERAIHKDRQGKYGDFSANMAGTSDQFNGLLRNWQANNPGRPLPGWWAPLCMVAVKLNRIASGTFHQDNFDDARIYLQFVEAMMQQGTAP